MAATDAQTLISEAKCYQCLAGGSFFRMLKIALLGRISQKFREANLNPGTQEFVINGDEGTPAGVIIDTTFGFWAARDAALAVTIYPSGVFQSLTLVGGLVTIWPCYSATNPINQGSITRVTIDPNGVGGDLDLTLLTDLTYLLCSNNSISDLTIPQTTSLMEVYAGNMILNATDTGHVLVALDNAGASGGMVDTVGNAVPSAAGQTAAANLIAKGWSVSVDV